MNNDIRDFQRKVKFDEFKRKLKDGIDEAGYKAKEIGKVIWDHRVEIAGMVLIATGAARTANKIANDHEDRKRQKRMTYDARNHEWYEARRDLSGDEKIRLDEMYNSGISKGDALKKMGLLK